ncbi:MAG: Bug family tripartite tricarboxylate transporter substrate binding protein [Burkholderiales bacterium]
MRIFPLGIATSVLAGLCNVAHAQSYPSKPVRLVVAFAAGGGTDVLARNLANTLKDTLGQALVIDNRPGAGTIIGTEAAAKSAPDGYTLLVSLDQSLTMNQWLYEKLPYDPVKDFAPVSLLANSSRLYVSNLKAPGANLRGLMDYAKANPGKLNYGSGAISGQVVGEQILGASGGRAQFISYNGGAPALTALLQGTIDFVIADITTFAPGVRDGRLRGLAVSGPKRSAQLPDVPTLREAGFAELESQAWWGLFAPAGTPRPIIDRINFATVKAYDVAELRQRIEATGSEPATSTPDQVVERLQRDAQTWGAIIKRAGIKVN